MDRGPSGAAQAKRREGVCLFVLNRRLPIGERDLPPTLSLPHKGGGDPKGPRGACSLLPPPGWRRVGEGRSAAANRGPLLPPP